MLDLRLFCRLIFKLLRDVLFLWYWIVLENIDNIGKYSFILYIYIFIIILIFKFDKYNLEKDLYYWYT